MERIIKTIVYLNLTNGIEAVDYFPDSRFVRIQSSHCESKAYNRLLQELSADFLLNLAQGSRVVIIDGGVNQKYPKAIRTGIRVIMECLNRAWFKQQIADPFYQGVWNSLDKSTKRRLRYYQKFLNTNRLHLLALGFETRNDGNYRYYARKLKGMNSS